VCFVCFVDCTNICLVCFFSPFVFLFWAGMDRVEFEFGETDYYWNAPGERSHFVTRDIYDALEEKYAVGLVRKMDHEGSRPRKGEVKLHRAFRGPNNSLCAESHAARVEHLPSLVLECRCCQKTKGVGPAKKSKRLGESVGKASKPLKKKQR
jgi:hypothetical protein